MAMEFSGEYRIPARQQQVWDALNDPAVLQASIAGCKQLDKLSDTEFSAVVVTRVGPISATFRGAVTLSELDAPRSYTLTGQGQGGAAGFAKMRARVELREEGAETVLTYTASAEIGGKLASVGSRLVQTVAKKNADDFFSAFARQLGGSGELAAPARAAAEGQQTPAAAQPVTHSLLGSLAAPVPAWLVVFTAGLGIALGYFLGR